MSAFPRIDPAHPLAEAARNANAYCEEHGLEDTIEWAGMELTVGHLAYLAEQRAYRAVAAMGGHNLGTLHPSITEEIVDEIRRSPLWADLSALLIGAYMDALVIGWVARGLKDAAE